MCFDNGDPGRFYVACIRGGVQATLYPWRGAGNVVSVAGCRQRCIRGGVQATLYPWRDAGNVVSVAGCRQRWDRWLKRFVNFTVAKRITNDPQKKAMLLHYAGEEVFALGESLGIVDETSFDDTIRVHTEYFAPQRNEEYEVFVFRQAAQLADETLDKFNARLRQIARNCNFHDVDREVRSKIIQKCQSARQGTERTKHQPGRVNKVRAYFRGNTRAGPSDGRQWWRW